MTGNGVGWARTYNFKNLCTSHFLKLSTGWIGVLTRLILPPGFMFDTPAINVLYQLKGR